MNRVIVKEIPKESKLRSSYRYEVDARPIGGKRKRFKHGHKEQAEAYANEVFENYSSVAESNRELVSERLITEAVECSKKLSQFNATLTDAVAFYVQHLETVANTSATPISHVVGLLRQSKEVEGCSVKYLQDLKSRLNIFEKAFENRPIAEITSKELQEWILKRGSRTTSANYRRVLNVLFNYAKKHGVIENNPIDKVDKVKATTAKGCLTAEQATSLLNHCDNEILPAVAIMLFSGIRPDFINGELSRLDWSHVQLSKGNLRLDESITKSKSTRNVEITDNLKEWLAPYNKIQGKVIEDANRFRKLFEQARKDAGLYDNWISDVTRKSFITYHVALHQDENKTMTQSGHTNVSTLRNHYKGLADKSEALAYFSICPEAIENVIPLKMA